MRRVAEKINVNFKSESSVKSYWGVLILGSFSVWKSDGVFPYFIRQREHEKIAKDSEKGENKCKGCVVKYINIGRTLSTVVLWINV